MRKLSYLVAAAALGLSAAVVATAPAAAGAAPTAAMPTGIPTASAAPTPTLTPSATAAPTSSPTATATPTVGPTATSTATAPPPPPPTLSIKALNGPAVAVGDNLTSSLTAGTQLSVTSAAGGALGLFCKASTWSSTATANPPVPGPAVLLVNALTVGNCTDNLPTVQKVVGVAVRFLPSQIQVNGAAPFPVVLQPGGAIPLELVVSLLDNTGAALTCIYQAAPPTNGSTGLGAVPWKFVNQNFSLVGAVSPPCAGPILFFSASYSPVIDVTAANTTVFVN